MAERKASVARDTLETQIQVAINLDGTGQADGQTCNINGIKGFVLADTTDGYPDKVFPHEAKVYSDFSETVPLKLYTFILCC